MHRKKAYAALQQLRIRMALTSAKLRGGEGREGKTVSIRGWRRNARHP